MKIPLFFLLACTAANLCAIPAMASSKAEKVPIRLDPANPHYFLFRQKPTVLITSGEHYGAVMNTGFDYHAYLKVLQADGLNLTRVFTGSYREPVWGPGTQNTLAPRSGQYLAPSARSRTPGYKGGGNKFDLDRWDDAYFHRLKDFVETAGKHGVVVEVVFFSQMYADENWHLSPLYRENNVNGIGKGTWQQFASLQESALIAREDALIRKIVAELRPYDNVYYELCNEPYSPVGTAKTRAWLDHLADATVAAESAIPVKHLIAVQDPSVCDSPAISVYNFHYAYGDTWVGAMQGLERFYDRNKALAFDETETVDKATDEQTRRDAWAFLLSGGAVYDHLDMTFATDDATGAGKVEQDGKRYDGTGIRRQLGFLKRFIERFDFARMHPAPSLLVSVPTGAKAYLLAQDSKAYALFLQEIKGGGDLILKVPAGQYRAEWWNPVTGTQIQSTGNAHHGGNLRLTLPSHQEEVALRLAATASRN